jgi:hypothetical protein
MVVTGAVVGESVLALLDVHDKICRDLQDEDEHLYQAHAVPIIQSLRHNMKSDSLAFFDKACASHKQAQRLQLCKDYLRLLVQLGLSSYAGNIPATTSVLTESRACPGCASEVTVDDQSMFCTSCGFTLN